LNLVFWAKKEAMRIREIKRVGGSWDIRLLAADAKDFKFNDGDLVCIDDIFKVKEDEENE